MIENCKRNRTYLVDVIPVLEVTITAVAVEVDFDFVVAKIVYEIEVFVTVITFVSWFFRFGGFGPVARNGHMLSYRALTSKILIARITFEVGGRVAGRVHVLLA